MSKDKYLNVRLSEEDYEAFKAVCHNEGTTVSKMVRQYVHETLVFSKTGEWE